MRRRSPLLALLLLVVAWALRLHDLGRQELWFDEAATYLVASAPVPDILSYCAGAVFEHPPLYYVVLHGFVLLIGGSEWALRFPSVAFGTIFVAGVWRAARRTDQRLAAWATGIAAISGFLVTYAQEARMYALLQCLGLLSTYLLYRAWRKCGIADYAAYGASMVAGVLTHYFFAFLFVAHACMALVLSRRRARTALRLALAAGVLALAVGAWMARAPGLRQALLQVWQESLWGKSPAAIATIARDWALGGAIIGDRPTWEWLPTLLMVAVAGLGLTYRGLPGEQRLALAIWVVVPIACAIALPYGGLALRHFSYIAPALLALTAAGLLRLGRPLPLAIGGVAVGAVAIVGTASAYSLDKGQYGAALAEVTRQARSGDVLILGNPHQWVLANYYERSGLERHYVGDGRALPGIPTATEGQQRLWVAEWETWALEDWATIMDTLRQATFEGVATTYSNDVSLRLLYVTPEAAPSASAGVTWDGARAATSIDAWGGDLRPGDAALVAVSWLEQPPLDDTAVVLRLVDSDGRTWAQTSGQPIAQPGRDGSLVSRHALVVPGGTPPGVYSAELGVIDLSSGAQLAATGAGGVALGPWVSLVEATVKREAYAPPNTGEVPRRLATLVFHGSESDATVVTAGDRWSGIAQFAIADEGSTASLSLSLEGGGRAYDLGDVALAAGPLTSDQWRAGEVWRCVIEARLPADALAGDYRLVARQANVASDSPTGRLRGHDSFTIDEFRVEPRELSTVDRLPTEPLDVLFADQVRLEGYDAELDGDDLLLRLYWRALGPTSEAQKVFVHLTQSGVDEPVAQDDAYPAAVMTSDWLPGECFLSEHRLAAAALDSRTAPMLVVGLYNERTMARLPASGADAANDHVLIPLTLP